MLNNVSLIGRITHPLELKKTPTDYSVLNFCIAVARNKNPNGERITDFIDCVAWNKTAEFINRYFTKGQLIALKGSIQTRVYVDKEEKKRKDVEILVDNVYFIEPKKSVQESSTPEKDEYTFEDLSDMEGDLPF